jgi:hypothetical protein
MDTNKETDRRGARQVNLLIQMLGSQLDLKTLNKQLFFKLYKNGTVIGEARPLIDPKKFGVHQIPNLIPHTTCLGCGDTQPSMSPDTASPQTCPQCGGPLAQTVAPNPQQPVLKIPVRSVGLDLFDGYTHTWPFSVKFQIGALRYAPWIVAKSEKDRGEILKDAPQARKIVGMGTNSQYASGDPSDATGAVVRAAAQSQTGTIRSRNLNVWTEAQYHIDAAQLELIDDDPTRALCKQFFADGLFIVQIEGKTVSIHNADYRKKLSVCTPTMSDYLFTDGHCWAILGLEDAYSNLLAIIMETLETGVTRFLVNEEYVSADDLNRQRYSPNRFQSMIPKYGDNVAANAIVPIPTSNYPQQIPETFSIIDGLVQNILGLLPQVYGQMPGNLTLGQARMMLTQGLMQLSTVAELAASFWEASWTNLVNMYCDIAVTNPEFQGETIDLDLIRQASWVIKSDTSIPRSFAERVESLRALLQESPQVVPLLKITDPSNTGKLRDYLDLPDFNDPDEDAMGALSELIDQLWQAQPMPGQPGPPDPMTGAPGPPGPPQPSVPFDGMIFDPVMAVSLCRAALLKAMLKPSAQRSQDSPGFANVKAFLAQAQQAATPPPPGPPPPKLSISAKIPDLTPEQEGAVLSDFGVTVPPPHLGAIMARAQNKMSQNANTPPNGGPPAPSSEAMSGPPPLSPPGGMMAPGAPGIMQPPIGAIQ